MKLNPLDPSDQSAMEPYTVTPPLTTATSYNIKGMPTPPAGWGKVIGFVDSVDGDDEGPESPDEC
jgi:hypothetical protein